MLLALCSASRVPTLGPSPDVVELRAFPWYETHHPLTICAMDPDIPVSVPAVAA